MAKLDDYFSLVMDNHLALRNMGRLPSAASKNSAKQYQAYERNRRADEVRDVLNQLEADTDGSDAIHSNLVRMLDSLITTFSAGSNDLPSSTNDNEVAEQTMRALQRVCTAAIQVGCEAENSELSLSFGRMDKTVVMLVIETLKLAKQELLDYPFRHKRDAVDFLTKYTLADGAKERGISLVMTAAKQLGWK